MKAPRLLSLGPGRTEGDPHRRTRVFVRGPLARGPVPFQRRRPPGTIADSGRSPEDRRRRGGCHRRGVGWSRSHVAGIRPRPSHIPHGASQDHWRGSASSWRHANRPRPPHPGQGTVGGPAAVSCLRKSRVKTLSAIPTPSWGRVPRLPPWGGRLRSRRPNPPLHTTTGRASSGAARVLGGRRESLAASLTRPWVTTRPPVSSSRRRPAPDARGRRASQSPGPAPVGLPVLFDVEGAHLPPPIPAKPAFD